MTVFLPGSRKKKRIMMRAYNRFATVYDELTDNVEYKKRTDYIHRFFKLYNIAEGSSVIDLACGTGSFSALLAEKGYDVTGIDSSDDMLTVAASKCGGNVKLLKADMRSFHLEKQCDACICCLDSINHLENIDDVKRTFRSINDSLFKGGLFIFDMNTLYKHKKILADSTFVFDKEDYFLSWDNEYAGNGKINIFLDLFIRNGNMYKRYSEEFSETAYRLQTIKAALKPFFEIEGIYDDLSLKKPERTSERLYFICRSI